MSGRYDEPEKPPCVLVVDDDPSVVDMVRLMLTSAGYKVLGAGSGEEALEVLASGVVNLVILDLRMPRMDGMEVCRRIRSDASLSRVPVVFLTAEGKDLDLGMEALELGGDDYLSKPVHRRVLVARVRNLLRLADAERDRRLQAQVAQTEKLAAIGQIAAGVAHEINNPLAFVISNLNCLKGYLDDVRRVVDAYRESPEQGKTLERDLGFANTLQDIEALIRETAEGGQRVRKIVSGLKTFSRQDDTSLEPVDLADVAASTLLLTERELNLKAKLVRSLEPAPIVRAPRGPLHQVVLNLLINAVQALDGKKGDHEIRIATRTEDGYAVLAVSDTGCGIKPEHQTRIFEPFFTTKPVGVGTGMGLSVTAAVVQKLGGRIALESALGVGSTFTIHVPFEPPVVAAPQMEAPARSISLR